MLCPELGIRYKVHSTQRGVLWAIGRHLASLNLPTPETQTHLGLEAKIYRKEKQVNKNKMLVSQCIHGTDLKVKSGSHEATLFVLP